MEFVKRLLEFCFIKSLKSLRLEFIKALPHFMWCSIKESGVVKIKLSIQRLSLVSSMLKGFKSTP